MTLFSIIAHIKELFSKGAALTSSGILTNTEALASSLYGVMGVVILLLNDFGVPVVIGGTDLHTMTSGLAIAGSFLYSIYRVVSNPAAGFKAS